MSSTLVACSTYYDVLYKGICLYKSQPTCFAVLVLVGLPELDSYINSVRQTNRQTPATAAAHCIVAQP